MTNGIFVIVLLLSFFATLGARPGEALKIRVVPVDIHISVLSASGEALAIIPIIPDLGRDVQQFWVAQGRFANHSRNRRLTGPRS